MKNAIIKYGLISGAISAVCMCVMGFILKSGGNQGFDNTAYVGFTLIFLAMAVIFLGIKAYRDKENDGKVSFGKGLMIGLGIALISSVCYSLMWLVVYHNFMPNFIEDYAKYTIEKLKASGASEAELLKTQEENNFFRDMYKTPFGTFAVTLIEPLPIGIIIALVSAIILKRK